jgi:acyl carrier protein
MRTREEIAGRIRQVVEEVTLGATKALTIEGSASLLGDLRLDSLDYATVLLSCEEWLGVRIPEDRVDWRLIGTVDGLASFLYAQQGLEDITPQ